MLQVKQINTGNGSKIHDRELNQQVCLPADQKAHYQSNPKEYHIGEINVYFLFLAHAASCKPANQYETKWSGKAKKEQWITK
jgi:hypothetical protein